MSADAPPGPTTTPLPAMAPNERQSDRRPRRAQLPPWYPAWALSLADLYFSGASSVFVLHGNTYDLVPLTDPGENGRGQYGGIPEFLAEQMFGRWDLVLHYDLGRGLRVFAGRDERRLKEMVALATKRIGDLSTVKNDPAIVLGLLDLFVRENIMATPERRLSAAVLISHASYLFPAGEPGRLSFSASGMLVTLLNWATSAHVKRLEMAFVAIDERRTDLSDRITGNPHVATIEVPLPGEPERLAYIRDTAGSGWSDLSDYTPEQLATLSAGMSLNDLAGLIQSAAEGVHRLSAPVFRGLKKRLIETEAQPFRPEFRTGEDQDFFRRMIDQGHTFAWCNEALAYEVVPPIRWKRTFLLRRALLRGAVSRVHPTFGALAILKSAAAAPLYAAALPIALVMGQGHFMSCLVKLCDHLGVLLASLGINPISDPYVSD